MGNHLHLLVANSLKAEPPYAGQVPVTLSLYVSTGIKKMPRDGACAALVGKQDSIFNSLVGRQLECEGAACVSVVSSESWSTAQL